jgi:hypothetical protein
MNVPGIVVWRTTARTSRSKNHRSIALGFSTDPFKQAQSGVDLRQKDLELGTLVGADVIVLQPVKYMLFLSEKPVDRRHRGRPICVRSGPCPDRSRPGDEPSAVLGSEPSLSFAPQRGHLKSISVSGRPRELVAAIGQQ